MGVGVSGGGTSGMNGVSSGGMSMSVDTVQADKVSICIYAYVCVYICICVL